MEILESSSAFKTSKRNILMREDKLKFTLLIKVILAYKYYYFIYINYELLNNLIILFFDLL